MDGWMADLNDLQTFPIQGLFLCGCCVFSFTLLNTVVHTSVSLKKPVKSNWPECGLNVTDGLFTHSPSMTWPWLPEHRPRLACLICEMTPFFSFFLATVPSGKSNEASFWSYLLWERCFMALGGWLGGVVCGVGGRVSFLVSLVSRLPPPPPSSSLAHQPASIWQTHECIVLASLSDVAARWWWLSSPYEEAGSCVWHPELCLTHG